MNKVKLSGIVLAMGAAAAFAMTPVSAIAKDHGGKMVQCMGVNGCKGKGDCKMPGGNSCKGKNDCKGKDFVKMTKHACDAINGSTESNASSTSDTTTTTTTK